MCPEKIYEFIIQAFNKINRISIEITQTSLYKELKSAVIKFATFSTHKKNEDLFDSAY